MRGVIFKSPKIRNIRKDEARKGYDPIPEVPEDYPREFDLPRTPPGGLILWRCIPLKARLTEEQCEFNRRQRRRRRRWTPIRLSVRQMARVPPALSTACDGPCKQCPGVVELAKRTGIGPVVFARRRGDPV